MSFCDFVPDDPSCQQEPTPAPQDEKPAMEDGDKGERDAAGSSASAIYLIVGLVNLTAEALRIFRYRSSATYYDDGNVLGTNYWMYASKLS